MDKEDCKVGGYSEMFLRDGVLTILDEFEEFDFFGVHYNYESFMEEVLDYSLENEDCDYDHVDIDNEVTGKT